MKREVFSSTIPFSGFYGSWHQDIIDTTEERMFSDHDENEYYQHLADIFYQHVDYSEVYEEYAKFYVEILRDLTSLKSMKYEEIRSPREYNFETDRIFVSISREDLAKMLWDVRGSQLNQQIKDTFTSRSGFISFYPNHIHQWPQIEEWDHNHVGAVMSAYLNKNHEDIEYRIVEDLYGHGSVDSFLYDAADYVGQSAVDVAYIKSRMKEESNEYYP